MQLGDKEQEEFQIDEGLNRGQVSAVAAKSRARNHVFRTQTTSAFPLLSDFVFVIPLDDRNGEYPRPSTCDETIKAQYRE